jgi:hypothetical protein
MQLGKIDMIGKTKILIFHLPCTTHCLQACNRMSMCCVPLYDSLGENAIEYIINHSEVLQSSTLCTGQKFLGAVVPQPLVVAALLCSQLWHSSPLTSCQALSRYALTARLSKWC